MSRQFQEIVPARNPGFQIAPELTPLSADVFFAKLTMSAFEGTWLDIALRDCGINSFIVVGVATEVGIRTNCAPRQFRSRLHSHSSLRMPAAPATTKPPRARWKALSLVVRNSNRRGSHLTLRRLVHGILFEPHLDRLPHVAVVPSDSAVSLAQRRGLILALDNKEFAC